MLDNVNPPPAPNNWSRSLVRETYRMERSEDEEQPRSPDLTLTVPSLANVRKESLALHSESPGDSGQPGSSPGFTVIWGVGCHMSFGFLGFFFFLTLFSP